MNIKFQSVKAQISSFERGPVEMGKISQLNLGKHTCIDINNFSQICNRYQQGPFQNLKFWKFGNFSVVFFKNEHVNPIFQLILLLIVTRVQLYSFS